MKQKNVLGVIFDRTVPPKFKQKFTTKLQNLWYWLECYDEWLDSQDNIGLGIKILRW